MEPRPRALVPTRLWSRTFRPTPAAWRGPGLGVGEPTARLPRPHPRPEEGRAQREPPHAGPEGSRVGEQGWGGGHKAAPAPRALSAAPTPQQGAPWVLTAMGRPGGRCASSLRSDSSPRAPVGQPSPRHHLPGRPDTLPGQPEAAERHGAVPPPERDARVSTGGTSAWPAPTAEPRTKPSAHQLGSAAQSLGASLSARPRGPLGDLAGPKDTLLPGRVRAGGRPSGRTSSTGNWVWQKERGPEPLWVTGLTRADPSRLCPCFELQLIKHHASPYFHYSLSILMKVSD